MRPQTGTRSLPQLNSTVSRFLHLSDSPIENLTKEQYSGLVPTKLNGLSASRDTLNPLLNAKLLKQRLAAIEHYQMQHGIQYARWPHFFLSRVGSHMYKYKFNYALKGFAAYLLYREV